MVKRAPARRRPRKAKPGTKGLGPGECRLDRPSGSAMAVAEAIEKAGGCVVGSYKDPLGHPRILLFRAALGSHPINKNKNAARVVDLASGNAIFTVAAGEKLGRQVYTPCHSKARTEIQGEENTPWQARFFK
jgi:hypothetical protein